MNKMIIALCCVFWGANVAAQENNIAANIHANTLSHGELKLSVKNLTKPTVILFSDSLCPFRHLPQCEQKIAVFNDLVSRYQDKAQWLQIVKGYYVDEQHVRGYVERFKFNVPTIWDTDNKIFTDYQVFGNPYLIIVDQQGQIYYRTEEFGQDLNKAVKSL